MPEYGDIFDYRLSMMAFEYLNLLSSLPTASP